MNKIKETEKEWMRFDRANRKMISSYDPSEEKKAKGIVLRPRDLHKILVK